MQTFFNLLVKFLSERGKRLLDTALRNDSSDRNDSFNRASYWYWERQADFWSHYPSPIRLSAEDIKIYSNFLSGKKDGGKVLILGSTPELRDLVAGEGNAKVYLADFSYLMPVAMLKFTTRVDPLKETWVKTNWLDLPFREGFFDMILGDLVLSQFPPDLELKFFKKVRFLLKNDGFFLSRFQFIDNSILHNDIGELVKKILAGSFLDSQKYFLLKLHLLWLFADPVKRKLNRKVSAQKFAEFIKNNNIKDTVLEKVSESLIAEQNSFRDWSPPTEEQLIRKISSEFVIDKMLTANDYEESRIYPIFSLTPKK